ncbi:MAG: aspartyl-phosphate phosphatase Spo0E family protein [Peptococcaceae bacterium]|nr:aspartyl-phosphate phosphatase Spo0E family protein [Peptococcaceae bacterium]
MTYEELFLEIEHLRSQMIALASRGADHDQVLEVSRRLDELYSALP